MTGENRDSLSVGGGRWPAPWGEITEPENTDGVHVRELGHSYMQYQEGMRGYDGTLYVSVDVGSETDENRDLWMPFDVYIRWKTDEVLD